MSILIRIFAHIAMISLLTAVTQVGGAIWLICLGLMYGLKVKRPYQRAVLFISVYLVCLVGVIPVLARKNDRVPLPIIYSKEFHLRPHTLFTSLAFRNYVRPELLSMIEEVATEMHDEYPGIKIEYLDANFPLLKRFRMLPHLRHDNGKKLDVAYIYKNEGRDYGAQYLSFFGYGFSVKPEAGETDMPARCAEQGRWQYNIIEKIVPDRERVEHRFAVEENASLMRLCAEHPATKFVILEPHLRERLGLMDIANIRSFGCWAVRHDDHAHIQAY